MSSTAELIARLEEGDHPFEYPAHPLLADAAAARLRELDEAVRQLKLSCQEMVDTFSKCSDQRQDGLYSFTGVYSDVFARAAAAIKAAGEEPPHA